MIVAEVIDITSDTYRRPQKMKKIMTLMLGLSFLMGTVSMFAQDKPADAKTEKKAKKAKKKKADKPADEKK
jgi:hypothetical protein